MQETQALHGLQGGEQFVQDVEHERLGDFDLAVTQQMSHAELQVEPAPLCGRSHSLECTRQCDRKHHSQESITPLTQSLTEHS